MIKFSVTNPSIREKMGILCICLYEYISLVLEKQDSIQVSKQDSRFNTVDNLWTRLIDE